MPSVNIVTLCGNLTRDPDVRKIPSGQSVCDLGLAVNESYKDKTGERKESALFVDVVAWGNTAEACGHYLRKGAPVLVTGKLQMDAWEKDGQKRTKLRVRADNVQFLGQPSGERREQPSQRAAAGAPNTPPQDDDTDIPF